MELTYIDFEGLSLTQVIYQNKNLVIKITVMNKIDLFMKK